MTQLDSFPSVQPNCAGDQTAGVIRAFISSRCSEYLSGQKVTQKSYLLIHRRCFIHVVIVTVTAVFALSEQFCCQVLGNGAPTDLVFLKMKRLSNSQTWRLNITKPMLIIIFEDFKCPEHNIYLLLVTSSECFVNNFFSRVFACSWYKASSFMNQASLVITEYSLPEPVFFLLLFKIVPNSSAKALSHQLKDQLNFRNEY